MYVCMYIYIFIAMYYLPSGLRKAKPAVIAFNDVCNTLKNLSRVNSGANV